MEGKEVRFGEAASALFGAATTGTSTGAVNSMHDSFTAPGGGVAMFNMMLGEIAPGGVGSGLYGMLMLAVVTVFLAGLMVGPDAGVPRQEDRPARDRPGRALRAHHPGRCVLVGIAVAITVDAGLAGLLQTAGRTASPRRCTPSPRRQQQRRPPSPASPPARRSGTRCSGSCMLLGRFLPIVFVLALAGRFAAAASGCPPSAGTLPTHRPLFVVLLTGVALVVVGLTYVPVLVLGPIVESLS